MGLSTGRLEALSDGVLAIVITLLVMDFFDLENNIKLKVQASCGELLGYLFAMWPHVLGYVLSFVLIAVYWIVHHFMFHHIRHADRWLLWLNLLFLMAVAFLPFPTDLLAECIYHESNVIVVIYGMSHAFAGLMLASVWWYATHNRRLVAADLPDELIRATTHAALFGPGVYTIGALASFINIPLGIGIYALAPVLYVFPGQIDRLWISVESKAHSAAEQVIAAGDWLAESAHVKSKA
jgi:uncharacterized membrane protein